MGVTISEIARVAGCSKTTVSRVINNKPDVKIETRERIYELIKKYDFQPNAFATAISKKKSQTIGLIIPYQTDYIFSNHFYTEVIRGISEQVNSSGYYLLMCYSQETDYIDVYKQKRVDGFILLSPGSFHVDIIKMLEIDHAPFVTTSKVPNAGNLVYVDVDNYYGATLAVEHLIKFGHKKIAYITNGPEVLASRIDRLNGYRASLYKHSLEYDERLVKVGDTTIQSGYFAMHELLQEKVLFTAVFVGNDMMVPGVVKALKENKLSIPDEISVIGFDDIPISQVMDPPLTTIRQPAFDKGAKAASLLVEMIEGNNKLEPEILPIELIIRQSTGPVKA